MFFSLSFLNSCKKENVETDAGYEYFPTNIGHWVIYEVDSTAYRSFFNDTIHVKYQVKEYLESTYIDNQGREAIRVERYKRPYIDSIPYDSLPWTISRVWSFVRNGSEGEKQEENQRFIRMTFVPREGKKWNGNAYNTIGEWEYEYMDVDVPYSINSLNLDSTALIQQICDTNALSYTWYQERYAKHIGLIEKTVFDVEDDALGATSVLTRINDGEIYTIKLVDWGPR